MASWANPDEGLCPECGHPNSRRWILCDKCGKRLPWAPPEAKPLKPGDMTEEQLAAIYGRVAPREPFFLFLPENRMLLRVVVSLIGIVVSFIAVWLRGR